MYMGGVLMIIHHYSEVIDLSELNGDETETS